ncbi:hypothetical protein COLO4_13620 [Corchorus olitorius]|uniref:Uncharacterized protein n=1 Tax=Corchorus olitorius TaxID=93759 RepID=A0A1R3JVV6_9ROSI|nr:hypothetical protein COLO4_13620 [Corchorus olitorius]
MVNPDADIDVNEVNMICPYLTLPTLPTFLSNTFSFLAFASSVFMSPVSTQALDTHYPVPIFVIAFLGYNQKHQQKVSAFLKLVSFSVKKVF